ncbi:hypothetical protein [Streptomyces sp. NBC_00847]|uniref:hypothetical protein n=1 Tax=Streptomyces sp. NBC_00847 TaxID=2975850 RepID=UPI00225E5ACD|nr:hypothetical protein [Streptomyces sp. NBC_00847]MCX4885941.1 hypothetical protein [Streptomyces sp. NBC_00847]
MPKSPITSRTAPDVAAIVTAELLGLPTGRTVRHDNAAHIFLDHVDGLAQWLHATGGYTTRRDAGPGVVLWTLITHTELRADGTATPILVHAPALAIDLAPDELLEARA